MNTGTVTRSPGVDRVEGRAATLRLVLRANATTSLAGGLLAAAAPGAVDDVLDTGHPGWVRLVGIGLVLFAAWVAFTSTRPPRPLLRETYAIIAGDVSWVVASAATVALGWYSAGGVVLVAAVAVMVATWATLQTVHARRVRQVLDGGVGARPASP